ncbi:MAG: hypothetical protein ACRED0_11800 [Gammaproteobacteria bacterium]
MGSRNLDQSYERRWPFGDVIFAIVVNKGNGGVSFYNTTEDVVANADKVVAFLTSRAIVSLIQYHADDRVAGVMGVHYAYR